MKKYTALGVSIFLLFVSCKGSSMEPVSSSEIFLGTSCFITIHAMENPSLADEIMEKAFSRISDMEERLSVNIPESEVSTINKNGEGELSEDSLLVLKKANIIAEESDGRFDPSIGSLVALWDIGGDHQKVPDRSEIEESLIRVDYNSIKIDGNRIILLREGMRLDLGGIAKGHAADLVKKVLEEAGVTSAIINLGGNVQLIGSKPDSSKWRIGIQNPRDSRGEYIGILSTRDSAVVTSGIYERFFEQNGIHYHHILDTETGYPVDNGIESLTVIGDDSMNADGLSTALFSMGRKAAMKYAATHNNIEIIIIDEKDHVYISDGIKEDFKMSSSDFKLISK
jgi:FAD:protein FMN transferase